MIFRSLLVSLMFLFSAPLAWAGDIMISDISAPASLVPNAKAGALYFMVMNHGTEKDVLLSVSTQRATSTTLHQTEMQNDVAKMVELKAVEIPPGGMIMFEPGSKHAMLQGLDRALVEGEEFAVTFMFEKAGTVEAMATVGQAVAGHQHDKE
jgi:copper(I)-binding protein